MKKIKIGLAQINPTIGDLKGNLDIILNQIHTAKKHNIDIIVFPEMATTGYPINDLIYNKDLIKSTYKVLKKIQLYSKDFLAIIIGSIFLSKKYTSLYQKFYNGYALFSYGKTIALGKKICLPNYSVFNETRYFIPGNKIHIFKIENITFSILICEDIWHNKKVHPTYPFNPFEKISECLPDFIFSINASPFEKYKNKKRKKIICSQSKKYNIPIFYTNLWGLNDSILFDGNSFITNNKGHILSEGSYFSDDLLSFFWDVTSKSISPIKKTIFRYSHSKILYKAIVAAKKDYHRKSNIPKSIIGISGGIDSAVALSIDISALGKENVIAILSPSRYTSQKGLQESIHLCENFNISYYIIPIEEEIQTNHFSGVIVEKINRFKRYFKSIQNSISIENQQSIDRMSILRFLANEYNFLITGTSNKSEIALGYTSICGDLQADLLILGDLYKFEIYQLAIYINKKTNNKIPSFIINRPPSAELSLNQIDPFDYSILDRYVYLSIEKLLSDNEILNLYPYIFSKKSIELFSCLIQKSEHKRKNSSLIIRFHSRSFSRERKIPILKKLSFY